LRGIGCLPHDVQEGFQHWILVGIACAKSGCSEHAKGSRRHSLHICIVIPRKLDKHVNLLLAAHANVADRSRHRHFQNGIRVLRMLEIS
jgi:hypothetical protein